MKTVFVRMLILVWIGLTPLLLHADPIIGSPQPVVVEDDSVSASEVDAPFFLTTFSEIQELPEKDQKKYVSELREIAKGFPKEMLSASDVNECGKGQILCQPPLFGSGTCVAADKFDYSVCGQRSDDHKMSVFFREPSSESFWDDFEKKIHTYCDDSANTSKCKQLEDLRIKLFMTRKSH